MAAHPYLEAAEMYSNVVRSGWSRTPMKYHRFQSLAEAVKFAVEDLKGNPARVIIRTQAADFTGATIREIYDDVDFPLPRGSQSKPAASYRSA